MLHLGEVLWERGDHAGAARTLKQSADLWEKLGDRHGVALSLLRPCDYATEQKDWLSAGRDLEKCLRWAMDVGDNYAIYRALYSIGAFSAAREMPLEAARLYAAAQAVQKRTGRSFRRNCAASGSSANPRRTRRWGQRHSRWHAQKEQR
jgi:hypothetical protein